MNKKIIFLVNTELHLLLSYILYLSENDKEIDFRIIFIKQGNRFKTDINIPLKSYIYFPPSISFKRFKRKITPKEFLIKNNIRADQVYLFLDNELINTSFISCFKKQNAQISLIQEGLNAYIKEFIPITKLIKRYSKFLYFKYILGIFNMKFIRNWGSNPSIDNIHVQFPEEYKMSTNSTVTQLKLIVNSNNYKSICSLFNFEPQINITTNKVILFISQGFFSKEIRKQELLIFNTLAIKAKQMDALFILKLHPREQYPNDYNELSKNKNTIVMKENVPAELILFQLRDSYVLSWFSASLLFYVESNQYNWLYPIILKNKSYQSPTSHIKISQSINDPFI